MWRAGVQSDKRRLTDWVGGAGKGMTDTLVLCPQGAVEHLGGTLVSYLQEHSLDSQHSVLPGGCLPIS